MAKNTPSAKGLMKIALMKLMNEKPYMDITVTDVVNAAGVARVSFYRNFNSIGDIIDDIAEDIFSELRNRIYPVICSDDKRKWREMLFWILYKFSDLSHFSPPHNPQNVSVIFNRMNEKASLIENLNKNDNLKQKYSLPAKMGIIMNITRKWVLDGCIETPEEIVDYMMSFITLF